MSSRQKSTGLTTITEQTLEGLLKCPHRFYQQQVLGQYRDYLNWNQLVEISLQRVVRNYYTLPEQFRTAEQLLLLIRQHWTDQIQAFDSKQHFLHVLATVTEHLSRELLAHRLDTPPLFLYENHRVWMEELQMEVGYSFHLAEWTETSFRMRKYVVEETSASLEASQHLAIAFSQRAFGRVPEQIEIHSLLTGRVRRFHPQPADVEPALQYLQLTHSLLQTPYDRLKTTSREDCKKCPFSMTCNATEDVERAEFATPLM